MYDIRGRSFLNNFFTILVPYDYHLVKKSDCLFLVLGWSIIVHKLLGLMADPESSESWRSTATPSHLQTIKIPVPSDCVGRIIGKGGTRIQDLRNVSGASIDVRGDQGNQFVIIKGMPENVNKADTMIRAIINPDEVCLERIKVPEICVDKIIGMKFLKNERIAGTSIKFLPLEELDGQAGDRILEINGKRKKIAKAKHLIEELIVDIKAGKSESVAMIEVPEFCIAALIGKEGKQLREMENISGAKIKVHFPIVENEEGSFRNIKISGTKYNVAKAKPMIEQFIPEIEIEVRVSSSVIKYIIGSGGLFKYKIWKECGAYVKDCDEANRFVDLFTLSYIRSGRN